MKVKRFGVSVEEELLKKLDELVVSERFPNRSQAIRFLIKQYDVDEKWQDNEQVAGAIVLVYDHHKRDLQNKITALQHEYHCLVLAAQHVHLDHNNCIETLTVKGQAEKLIKLTHKLKAIKGIKHGKLVMSAPV